MTYSRFVTYNIPPSTLTAVLRCAQASPTGGIHWTWCKLCGSAPANSDVHARRARENRKRGLQPRTSLFEPTFLDRFDMSFIATLASRSIMARPSFAGFYVE